ncbi:MAG: hypothetical protein FJ218_06820 [Ignavibacteria bacterium]|nr:hypothetical protein [Ignavibacteria bacterium]
MNTLPSFVAPFLWSYDVASLDVEKHKKRIITNVLNLGTKEATDWLFATYSLNDIRDALIHPFPGEWNNKSLNFWSLVLDVTPGSTKREVK